MSYHSWVGGVSGKDRSTSAVKWTDTTIKCDFWSLETVCVPSFHRELFVPITMRQVGESFLCVKTDLKCKRKNSINCIRKVVKSVNVCIPWITLEIMLPCGPDDAPWQTRVPLICLFFHCICLINFQIIKIHQFYVAAYCKQQNISRHCVRFDFYSR